MDITTWLIPYEHQELIPGFKQRLDFLNAHWSNLNYKSFFTQDDLEFMNECYIGKMQLGFSKKTHVLYQNAILLFIKAIKYMLHKHNLPADEKTYQDTLLKNSRQLFEGQTAKRKLIESYMIRKKIKERSPGYLARWVLLDKRALSVLFNLNMHIAILAYIKNTDNDFSALLKAEQCLKSLNPDYKASPADPYFKLLHMRKCYADYLTDYERGYQTKKNYFYKLLEVK